MLPILILMRVYTYLLQLQHLYIEKQQQKLTEQENLIQIKAIRLGAGLD